MAGSQIATSVTILNSLKGFQAISLTEYNTSAAAAIAAGSVVEIAGAYFTFLADEPINAASWTAIVTGTTAYITLTASGAPPAQIVDVAYTATAPVWRDDLQGWYATAASNVRVIGSVYKAEAANYGPKYLYAIDQVSLFPKIKSTGSITCASALTVEGTATINGSPSYPYRATSETFTKTIGLNTITVLTTITSAYSINGSYSLWSTESTQYKPCVVFVSAGTIYGGPGYIPTNPGTTTISFIINYWY